MASRTRPTASQSAACGQADDAWRHLPIGWLRIGQSDGQSDCSHMRSAVNHTVFFFLVYSAFSEWPLRAGKQQRREIEGECAFSNEPNMAGIGTVKRQFHAMKKVLFYRPLLRKFVPRDDFNLVLCWKYLLPYRKKIGELRDYSCKFQKCHLQKTVFFFFDNFLVPKTCVPTSAWPGG